MIKYIKNVLWIVAKRLSYIQDARCLKFKFKLKSEKITGNLHEDLRRYLYDNISLDSSYSEKRFRIKLWEKNTIYVQ